MTLWAGRVGGELAPRSGSSSAADDAELLPYDWRRRSSTRSVCSRRASSTMTSSRRSSAELAEIGAGRAGGRGRPFGDRAAARRRRAQDPRGPVAQRPGRRGVPALRRAPHARRRTEAIRAFCAVDPRPRRGGRRHADARLHAPATRDPGHGRAPPARMGRDARARSRALRRGRRGATPSPLGSGALAGSTLPLPPPAGEQMRNSLDAVADRDFALDYLYACSVLFTHLSRIGEELVLWSTSEFGFVQLPESAATGSSMMPHKLNPDVAELVRGKAGTMIGRLTGLLAVVKGLPLAYDRDLQEDKSPVFAARRDVKLGLGALAVLVDGLELDRERLAAACADPLLRATDKAEAWSAAVSRSATRTSRSRRRCGLGRSSRRQRRRSASRRDRSTSRPRLPRRASGCASRSRARCPRRSGSALRSSPGTCRRRARRLRAPRRRT